VDGPQAASAELLPDFRAGGTLALLDGFNQRHPAYGCYKLLCMWLWPLCEDSKKKEGSVR